MRKSKTVNTRLSSYYIMIGLFVWFAMQSIIANYSIYYSYGLWLLTLLLLIGFVLQNQQYYNKNRKLGHIYLLSFGTAYAISTIVNSCVPDLTSFISLLFGFMFLIFQRETQYKIVKCFIWVFSIFILVSLVEYLLFQYLGVGIVISSVIREQAHISSLHKHLLFNLISQEIYTPRFQSIANEPGLIGTLCGLMLFSVGRDMRMKIPMVIFVLGGFFTFSLAFYVIAFLFLISGIINIKRIAIIAVSIVTLFIFVYNSFQDLILERIAVNSIEEIDNRSTVTFDYRFYQAWNNGQLWYGVGFNNLPNDVTMGSTKGHEGGNAGAKKWIFQYGIVSLIAVVMGLFVVYYRLRGRKLFYYDIVFLGVFWLSFYQRQTIETCYSLFAFCAVPLCEYFRLNGSCKISS